MDRNALNLPILISLVIGSMIGTGIYILPASLAEYGTMALYAWVLTAVGATFLALTFAHLNKRFPKTGGPYVYCHEAFGHLAGFLVAYTYWVSNLVSIAGITVSSVSYLGFITPILDANTPQYHHGITLCVELGFIWFFTLINIIGIHTAGVVQLLLTILKLMPLLIITLLGMGYIHIQHFHTFSQLQTTSPFHALNSAAALTFWAFIGLEVATIPAENTHGFKDIYRATVYGTMIASLIYIASTIVLMGMLPAEQLKHSQFPFADAATILFGSHAAVVIALCAVISGLGALNVSILVQGQIVFAAARDKLFPSYFTKLSQHDVPIAAQLLSSALVSLFLIVTTTSSLLKQFNYIALLASLFTLLTYFATTLAELRFLIKDKKAKAWSALLKNKSFYIACTAAIYAAWMILHFSEANILLSFVAICAAVPVYYLLPKKT
ncbi:MAG TPA: amino acid permease [Gammaproteobacteria bacterium]|jgi:APA family basic amino acid/polyamine antiporter|nr:amino acid permease [Gammaproteobacteria bacterium]